MNDRTTLPASPLRCKPAIPVSPPPRALRDLRRLARELDASLADVATLTLMVGITVIRQNWARKDAGEVAA